MPTTVHAEHFEEHRTVNLSARSPLVQDLAQLVASLGTVLTTAPRLALYETIGSLIPRMWCLVACPMACMLMLCAAKYLEEYRAMTGQVCVSTAY